MTFVPCPNCAKVEILGTCHGQEVVNVLHFGSDSQFSDGDLEALATALASTWGGEIETQLSNDYTCVSITATDVSVQDGHQFVYTMPENQGGIVSSAAVMNASACMTKRTDKRGRAYRGRLYFPAIPTNKIVSSLTLDPTWISALLSLASGLMDPESTGGFVLGVVSNWLNHVRRNEGHFEPVTALTMDTSVDSQRRRLAGRGV